MSEPYAARFFTEFVAPLWGIQDAPVSLADPLEPDQVDVMQAMRPGVAEEALYEQLYLAAQTIARGDIPWPNPDFVWLMAALHNALQLADPDHSTKRRGPLEQQVHALLKQEPALRTRAQVVVRHAVLQRLAQCRRRDTQVSFWAGSRSFPGRKVPARVTAWPRVRRVRQAVNEIELRETIAQPFADLWSAFLRVSPLTWLCDEHGFHVAFQPPEPVLLSVLHDSALRAHAADNLRRRLPTRLDAWHEQSSGALREAADGLLLETWALAPSLTALHPLLKRIPAHTSRAFRAKLRGAA